MKTPKNKGNGLPAPKCCVNRREASRPRRSSEHPVRVKHCPLKASPCQAGQHGADSFRQALTAPVRQAIHGCPRCTSVHARRPVASPCEATGRRNDAHSQSAPFESDQTQSPRYDPVYGLQQASARSRLGIAPGSSPSGCQRRREPRASVGLRCRIRAVFIHLAGSPSIHIDASKRVVHSSSTPAKPVVLPHPHMSPRKTSPFVANR